MSETPLHRIPRTLIIMGVCGCGKSLIGSRLAERFGGHFDDADDFHSSANKDKMRAGIPLTDEDRWPWYASLRARIEEKRGQTPLHVLACSALKASYRDRLSSSDEPSEIAFIHLKGTREVIHARMSARKDHYMPPTLLDSQFAILEETPDLISVSLDQTPEAIQSSILAAFS
jgi:gluconokinase